MKVFLHRIVALGSVCVVLAIAFYGGCKSYQHDPNFSPSEVYNLHQTCESGQFIGGCQPCSECQGNEFDGGGCSFFRDSSCHLCEPVDNCDIDNVLCTTPRDSTCGKCEARYWGDRCDECTVCKAGMYQVQECTHDLDTVCAPCMPCQHGLRLTKACSKTADSECTECSHCMLGTFMEAPCDTIPADVGNVWEHVSDTNNDFVYNLQADTVCTSCTETCGEGTYTSRLCTTMRDTECSACSACDDGEFIGTDCDRGAAEMEGTDTICQDCEQRPGDNFWELSPCLSTAGSDTIFVECSECLDWEWEEIPCGDKHDALCPSCTTIEHCKEHRETCTDGTDSVCAECEEGWFGEQCCYHKTFGDCGRNSNRERHPYREGYRMGHDTEALVKFCVAMCDGFPDCLAVEVIDGGDNFESSGPNELGGQDTVCHFLATYTLKQMKDPSLDCYSDACRQRSEYHPHRTTVTVANVV